jgi:N-acetylmuramoyl-L-alanine amidase
MGATLETQLSALDLVALTIWGEARGLDLAGRIAVGLVIAHRAAHPKFVYGEGWSAVCLKPWAFSCWRVEGGKSNYDAVHALAERIQKHEAPKAADPWCECLWIAEGVMDGVFVDTVKGATHYVTRALYEQQPPVWARGVPIVAEVGGHIFFRR